MNSELLFKAALGIQDPWYIKSVQFDAKDKRLDIHIDFQRGATFPSPDPEIAGTFKAYDTQKKTWRHLNFFEHECHLHCRTPRVDVGEGRVLMVSPPWSGKSMGFTLLFEALLMQLCMQMPVLAVSRITGVSDDKIWRFLEKYVEEARLGMSLEDFVALGVDETKRLRGHDYITLFVDLNAKRTVYVAKGKAEPVVSEFKRELVEHGGKPENVKMASCDMSRAFIAGITKNFPAAEITFDRFHIMKIINEAVDKIRREEAKEHPILKKARWAVLKNKHNLTPTQSRKRWELEMSKTRLKTVRAMNHREAFQDVYQAETKEIFEWLLESWYQWTIRCKLTPMVEAARTIRRHWAGIVSWKANQISNGILEGFNSLVQAAKARARGYRTFKNFKIIVYLTTGKLDFHALNPHYRPIGN